MGQVRRPMMCITTGSAEPRLAERKHNFRAYAQKWFEVFSKPNVAAVTAITYERQLKNHIYPVLGKINVEDILPADVQRVFNEMDGAKETKIKVKNVQSGAGDEQSRLSGGASAPGGGN